MDDNLIVMKRVNFVYSTRYIAVILISMVFFCAGCNKKEKTSDEEIPKLVELADSIRNSMPDSALIIYNQIIAQISHSEIKKADSLILALTYTGIASTYSTTGEYKLAMENDSVALVVASGIKNQVVKAKALTSKGLTLFRLGEFEKAMDCYENAMNLAEMENEFAVQAKLYANMAMIFFNQGDIQKSIIGFRMALKTGKQIKDEMLIAGNYLNLAIVYINQSKNDSALQYNKLALGAFRKINDRNGELLCYKNLGSFYYNISDYNNAIQNFQLALDLAIEMGDQSNMADGYHNLSELYARIGDNTLATELLDKSIKIKEKLGDKYSLAYGYLAVGNLHYTRNNYTAALLYYKKSLAIFLDKELKEDVGRAYSYIGNTLSGLEKIDSAEVYYNRALELYEQVGNRLGLTNLYINLGDVYRVKTDYKKAEKYFFKALNSKRELNDEVGVMLVYNFLANLYLDQSKFETRDSNLPKLQLAEKTALQSYQMAKHLGLKPAMQEASQTLIKIYEKMEKYSDALFYSKEYNALSDSILDKAKIEALTFAEARWNVEKKQQEINNLENTKKLNGEIIKQKETEAKQQKLIIWFIVILFFLTLLSVSILALYVRKRREAVHQKQLDSIAILRLQNTRNTISPHFVFNVLNNIWAIIDDRENARSQFGNLTNLIRRSLIHTDQITISLEDEIEFVKSFTELQKFRLNNELDVKWDIDENVNFMRHVPGMILQIPVENAIKHALAPKPENRELKINICSDLEFLILMVADNGDGFYNAPSPFKGTGTGLKVLTKTMHILNEKNEKKMSYEVLTRNENGGTGTKVIIKIPLQYNYNLPGMTI
ncbi:MAG: tetratricopeptide repeat protein [Prolixibacteraceae bacterium]|nr:tetratricopeptide repeat protein [Prolixibacteraceae bacterium]